MRLICPNCNAQYNVDEALIPEEGRDVQCATCKKSWFQEKSFAEAPLKLTTPVAPPQPAGPTTTTPAGPAGPQAPRKTMGGGTPAPEPAPPVNEQFDRDELRRAVEEEISAKSGLNEGDTSEKDDRDEDSELLKSLRDQLADASDDEFDSGPATSRRRSVVQAAVSAGIPTDELLADRSKKIQPTDISLDFVEELNETAPKKRRLRGGMIMAFLLAGIFGGAYFFQDKIIEAYPQAEPFLEQYSQSVDGARRAVESMAAMVQELIANRDAGTQEPPAANE